MRRIAGNAMNAYRLNAPLYRAAGLTLTELMVVLSIATILLMIRVPSFSALIRNQKITTTANDFLMAVNLTRTEAINRGARVDLVPLEGGNWSKGWVVFVDKNANQLVDAGEEVIFSHGPVSKSLSIKSVLTDSHKSYLAYTGTGRTRAAPRRKCLT